MNDQKIDGAPRHIPSSGETPADESLFRTVGPSEIRIDAQHTGFASGDASSQVSAPPASAQAAARSNSKLLADASIVLQQLLAREIDIEQREVAAERRLAEVEAERLRFQSLRTQQLEELEQNRQRLKLDEAAVREKMAAVEGLLRQFDADRQAVEQERSDIERHRAALRSEILAELQLERQAVEAERSEVTAELTRARTLSTALDERHRQLTEQADQIIQSERERLWQSLIGEWEERRQQFQTEHDQWLATTLAEKQEIEREKAFYDAAVREAESDFVAMRERHEATLRAERDDWLHHKAAAEAELIAHRERELSTLQSQREEWERTYSIQRAELQSERSVLESRIRFQQEHLEKMRTDLERAQNEHRYSRQVECQHLEDAAQVLLKRMRQIDLYRSSVEEREKSLEREREVLQKSRRAMSSTNDLDRLSIQAEREAWDQERQIQQVELRRQQDLLATHSEHLESRRIRLDKLRAELEDTHRSTLEMRLAVEEAWVDLTQSVGQDEARSRVDQVRQTLVGYYGQLHEGLLEQRRELLDAQSKFERLRAEFLEERQKLTDWIALRDSELRVAEERLRVATAESAVRDTAWQAARDRWLLEKAEAEQVIRRLLVELGNQHRDARDSAELPSGMSRFASELSELAATTPMIPDERSVQTILEEDR